MMQEEKFRKACNDFTLLTEDQKEFILGILQALFFAKNYTESADIEDQDSVS